MVQESNRTPLKKRVDSFKFAFNGIKILFVSQVNAWIHGFFVGLVIWGGFFFNISKTEWCFCMLSIGVVLAAEAFNTALESITDLVSPEYHELAKKAKDTAAGAVLLTAIGALGVGVTIFWSSFWNWVGGFLF